MLHLLAAKRIMGYVKGTLDYGIIFPKGSYNSQVELLGYLDSDWSGDKSDSKSTIGYIFMCEGARISWCLKKKFVMALSSCEAEYIIASMSFCQATFLDTLIQEIKVKNSGEVKLFVDNKSVIDLTKHPVAYERSKHIETRFHFLREQVNKGQLILEHCKT